MSDPIFKPIFGNTWDELPPIIKKHYTNRPYTNDKIIAEGQLDVSCSKYIQFFAKLFWYLGTIPPINEKAVPVTVMFESKIDTKEFCLNRVFYFRNREPYEFHSRMVQVNGNEVIETMKFGICWRMQYFWINNKVILKHKGYAIKVLGNIIPLPITWIIGRSDAEEWSINDSIFEMSATITHPWLGKIYQYKGNFKVKEVL